MDLNERVHNLEEDNGDLLQFVHQSVRFVCLTYSGVLTLERHHNIYNNVNIVSRLEKRTTFGSEMLA